MVLLSSHGRRRFLTRFVTLCLGGVVMAVLISVIALPSPVSAQTVTNEEITNYAEAVLVMDAGRQAAYQQISDIMVTAEPQLNVADYELTCPNAQTLSDVPNTVRSKVRAILIDYCNNASTIVQESGLTVRRFNAITEAHRSDAELSQRIRDEIIGLQQ